MELALRAFEERKREVDAYLDFLQTIENQARSGPPRIAGAEHPISVEQQKILYAGIYLQLYNLVESTMTRCVDAVARAAAKNSAWLPRDLTLSLRTEWVRVIARTHENLTPVHRLDSALELCRQLVETLPISAFEIEKGGGGNWDDNVIEQISARLGFQLTVSQSVYTDVKRAFKNDLGPLSFVKKLRNDLAHGHISFAESAEGVTVAELRELKEKTVRYLQEVVNRFVAYVDGFEFLVPNRRPGQPA